MIYRNSFSHCLSAGIICLLVGGTLAAKTVFLVDNDLESQTELKSTQQWPAAARSLTHSSQKYTGDVEKLAYSYIDRLTQLPDQKAWCGSSQEISLVLAKAKSLHLIELNNLTQGKADIIVKLPRIDGKHAIQTQASAPLGNLRLYVNQANQGSTGESWCIAASGKK
jgi:hypothetical protein